MKQIRLIFCLFSVLCVLSTNANNPCVEENGLPAGYEKWLGTWNILGEFYSGELKFEVCAAGEFLCAELELKTNGTQAVRYRFNSLSAGQIQDVAPSEIMLTGIGERINSKTQKPDDKVGIRLFFVRYQKNPKQALGYASIGSGVVPATTAFKSPFIINKLR